MNRVDVRMRAATPSRKRPREATVVSPFSLHSAIMRISPHTQGATMYPTLENFVGNTPLVRLQRIPGNTSNVILAKLEGNNPAGSVKDRPAVSMISKAEARGTIKPGDALIEPTSG